MIATSQGRWRAASNRRPVPLAPTIRSPDTGAFQVAVVYVPLLNRGFETTALDATDWLLCTGMASTVLWADELRKLLSRRRTRVVA